MMYLSSIAFLALATLSFAAPKKSIYGMIRDVQPRQENSFDDGPLSQEKYNNKYSKHSLGWDHQFNDGKDKSHQNSDIGKAGDSDWNQKDPYNGVDKNVYNNGKKSDSLSNSGDYDYSKKSFCPPQKIAVPFLRTQYPHKIHVGPVIGWFFDRQKPHTIPLFLLFNPWSNDYLYTTERSEIRLAVEEKGYQKQGVAGYVLVDKKCGGVPLYRLMDKKTKQHFYTVSLKKKEEVIAHGWKFEGVAGYIYKHRQY